MTDAAAIPNVNSTDIFNLEHFFDLSPDLLCIAGYDGYFKRINPTVSKTLGYTDEELFARPINEFVHIDDQDITAEGIGIGNGAPVDQQERPGAEPLRAGGDQFIDDPLQVLL